MPSQQDLFDNAASKLRYQAYSRLQAAAVAFGEALPIPEIVTIGGQSDGKSSLLEALLGVSGRCAQRGSNRCNLGIGATVATRRVPRPTHACAPQFRFNVREVEMGTRRPLIVQVRGVPGSWRMW